VAVALQGILQVMLEEEVELVVLDFLLIHLQILNLEVIQEPLEMLQQELQLQ